MTTETQADKPKTSDPDNVFVSAGKKDASKVYVAVPFNYRDAQAAIREAGFTRFLPGSNGSMANWEMDKAVFESAEESIRTGARSDMALSVEARKAREDEIKAQKAVDKETAKAAAAENAEARAAASREAALERDKTRVPVISGSVEEGAVISNGEADVTVTKIGRAFTLDEASATSLAERFPGTTFSAGDEVAYASFEAPELEDDTTPSM